MSKRLQERLQATTLSTHHGPRASTRHRAPGAWRTTTPAPPTHTARRARRKPRPHGLSLSAVSGLARLSALPIAILRSRCERAESRETYKRRNSYKTYNTYRTLRVRGACTVYIHAAGYSLQLWTPSPITVHVDQAGGRVSAVSMYGFQGECQISDECKHCIT